MGEAKPGQSAVDKAIATQLANIQKKTGQSLEELGKALRKSGLAKHGELRDWAKAHLGLGHGDANTLVHTVLGSDASDGSSAAAAKGQSTDDVLAEIYSGPKEALRPIHQKVMAAIDGWGEFEIAPKKGYVSLRRKKQFAMLGPGTKTRVDLGINLKDATGAPQTERVVEQPAGGMCTHKVALASPAEVDAAVVAWLKRAFEAAG